MLQFAIIGFGGLGQKHFHNALSLSDEIRLTAICDIAEKRFTEVTKTNLGGEKSDVDLSPYRLYTDAEEMLEKEKLDFIITALPTFLHEKYAVMALNKGIHVFSEKPMARTLAECKNMVEAARRNHCLLSVGQCLRFDPAYGFLKELIQKKTYGELVRMELSRRSLLPRWGSENWFMDFDKSGGALLDLHVHDVDFMNDALGKPQAVFSRATHRKTKFDSITTEYFYEDGPNVRIEADWSLPDSYGFYPDIFAVFEHAVFEKTEQGYRLCPDDGEAFAPVIGEEDMYMEELRYFVDCISAGKQNERILPESAMQSIEIAFAEVESAETGKMVYLK